MEVNGVRIDNTFAEAFPAWVSSVIITAATRELAYRAAVEATGFGTSVIACPAEAGIDQYIPPQRTPDGRPGFGILIVHPSKKKLKEQLIERIAECVLTAPTTAASMVSLIWRKPPMKLHFFGDGYEYQTKVGDRNVWAIPLMGGDFLTEEEIGVVKGVAGGNFFIMGDSTMSALIGDRQRLKRSRMSVAPLLLSQAGLSGAGQKWAQKIQIHECQHK